MMQHWHPSGPARVKLERSADHDDGSWMIPSLIIDVSQCFCATDKKAAAQTALIPNGPVAVAILPDHKDLCPVTRRRFALHCPFHLRVPYLSEVSDSACHRSSSFFETS